MVLLLTPFKAPRALPAGVKVFDTTHRVSYRQKHLTPLFGVAITSLFLQCSMYINCRKVSPTLINNMNILYIIYIHKIFYVDLIVHAYSSLMYLVLSLISSSILGRCTI